MIDIDWSAAAIISVVVIAGNFLISRGMDLRDKKTTEDRLAKMDNLFSKLFNWKDDHMKDSADMRLEFSKQISQLTATLQVNQSQYAEIIRRLAIIEEHFQNKRRSTD